VRQGNIVERSTAISCLAFLILVTWAPAFAEPAPLIDATTTVYRPADIPTTFTTDYPSKDFDDTGKATVACLMGDDLRVSQCVVTEEPEPGSNVGKHTAYFVLKVGQEAGRLHMAPGKWFKLSMNWTTD